MIGKTRRSIAVFAAAVCVTGLAQLLLPVTAVALAPKARVVAHPSDQAATLPPRDVVCTATVTLGSTTQCALPDGGGTAQYEFSVPSADTVRYRVAIPAGQVARSMSLTTTGGAELCASSGFGTFDCAVPAGTYRLLVTVAEAATVYTSIDGVLAATCAASPDLSVGAPSVPADVVSPGASTCWALDAIAGDAFEMTLDVNGDQGLNVRVYDDTGQVRCTASLVTAFGRSTCTPSVGTGFRMFATPFDDTAQSAALLIARVSHPDGCINRAPDAFGVTARRGPLAPHQARCYTFSAQPGERVGVNLFGLQGPTGTLAWTLRDASGSSRCSGGLADATHPLVVCTLSAAGEYALFVSSLARDNVRYAASLVDLASTAGCTAISSTAWDTVSTTATFAAGEVDCHSFAATAGDVIRPAVYAGGSSVTGLLVRPSGTVVCTFHFIGECTVPSSGSYRAIVSTSEDQSQPYELWVIDESSEAGCTPTPTPDRFGTRPTRSAEFTDDNLTSCWSFDAPADAAYFVQANAGSGNLFGISSQIRSVDGTFTCASQNCIVGDAGTYLLVLTRAISIPADRDGSVPTGLYRIDRVPASNSCPAISTSFTGPLVAGRIANVAEVDCHRFSGSAGDWVVVRGIPTDSSITHLIFDRNGNRVCFALLCQLTGSGPYHLVSYGTYPPTGPYRFRLASLTRQIGCQNLAAVPFGHAPTRSFDLADRVAMSCYLVQMPNAGYLAPRVVATGKHAGVHVTVYPPGVTSSCPLSSEFGSCFTPSAGTYLLVLTSDRATSGKLGWFDLTSTVGCHTGPSLAFGEAAATGRIPARGAVDCLSVPYASRDDARYAFGPTPSGADLHGELIEGNGVARCGTFNSAAAYFPSTCLLAPTVTGPVRILAWADDSGDVLTGNFGVHAWRLNNPTGCTDIGSLHDGLGPLVGTLADAHDEVCYLAAARTGTMSVTTSNDDVPSDVPAVDFGRASGALICSVQGTGSCLLGNTAYALFVRRGSSTLDFTGHYRVAGMCTSGKCGPT